MQLTCKHCGHISKSLNILRDEAIAEVMLDFSKHLADVKTHNGKEKSTPFKDWMLDCQMLASVGPTVILVAKHSTLLDKDLDVDDYIQQKFSLLVDQIQDYMGIEVFDNKPSNGIDKHDHTGGEITITEEEMTEYPGLSLPQMT